MKLLQHRLGVLGAAGLTVGAALGGYATGARANGPGETRTTIFERRLANVPDKTLSAMTVDYAPGGVSCAHHHPKQAEVFAYVVFGAVRSKVNDEPEAVYQAGEFWYEPPGSAHSVSANASETEPARILAVIVADPGVTLTTCDR